MTIESNPYQAPNAEVSNPTDKPYQPKIFSFHGRIGRLRYIAYIWASYLFFIPAVFVVGLLSKSGAISEEITLTILGLAYIPALIFFFTLMKRRFNDLNMSGWMSLLILVPVANLFIGLWLLFGKGTEGKNNFGAMPVKNSIGVKLTAWLLLMIPVLGILAAIILPAYQDFVERAKQSESRSQ